MKKEHAPKENTISRDPLPGSRKIYVKGKLHDINVAMREIILSPTKLSTGRIEENPPAVVYDTSGPYTDPNYKID
ncbi:phosphomethylpyrimidine synthase ThiC, partial [Marivirga lumbricoides]